jgi:hypothetical protein
MEKENPVKKSDEVKLTLEDCKCAICYLFIVEPVKLKCSHFFLL